MVGTIRHEVPVALFIPFFREHPQAATRFFYEFIYGFVGYTELAEFAIASWNVRIYFLIFKQQLRTGASGGDQGAEYAIESRDTLKGHDQ